MLRVLFVDDESHILRGLRRSMAGLDDRWNMTFCTSGAEALELMEHEAPFDVVVSDMRMPAMDGAEFLGIVRQRHPETIRVILSGYAETESILRTVGPAHLYLAKPCSAEVLYEAVSRPLSLKRLLSTPKLRALLTGLNNLPSLPDLFFKLDAELRSPQCSTKSVAALIDKDMAMTAELLRLTNSAYFTVAAPVTTTLQAVRTIGLETIQILVLQMGIFRQFAGSASVAPLLEGLTRYCLTIARLAEGVALSISPDGPAAKLAHCAALLSRIGMLVLVDAYPQEYGQLVTETSADPSRLLQAEEKAFGANHAQVGAYLLGLWGFPHQMVEAVAFASIPSASSVYDNDALTALHAAMGLGPSLGSCLPEGTQDPPGLDMAYLIEARKDGLVADWRQLASDLSEKVT